MKDEHIWHSGPPPHIGWWNASWNRCSTSWRWWNGESWSASCCPHDPMRHVARMATLRGPITGHVEWTHYWPKNARVPRIDPTKENPTMDTETFNVGDAVRITKAHIKKMKASNRSSASPGYPHHRYITLAEGLLHARGEITHTFGTREYTVRFTEAPGVTVSLHMKECWFTRA